MSPQQLSRYRVCGYKIVNGKRETHTEYFSSGRDAYIIESWLKREGFSDVKITLI